MNFESRLRFYAEPIYDENIEDTDNNNCLSNDRDGVSYDELGGYIDYNDIEALQEEYEENPFDIYGGAIQDPDSCSNYYTLIGYAIKKQKQEILEWMHKKIGIDLEKKALQSWGSNISLEEYFLIAGSLDQIKWAHENIKNFNPYSENDQKYFMFSLVALKRDKADIADILDFLDSIEPINFDHKDSRGRTFEDSCKYITNIDLINWVLAKKTKPYRNLLEQLIYTAQNEQVENVSFICDQIKKNFITDYLAKGFDIAESLITVFKHIKHVYAIKNSQSQNCDYANRNFNTHSYEKYTVDQLFIVGCLAECIKIFFTELSNFLIKKISQE